MAIKVCTLIFHSLLSSARRISKVYDCLASLIIPGIEKAANKVRVVSLEASTESHARGYKSAASTQRKKNSRASCGIYKSDHVLYIIAPTAGKVAGAANCKRIYRLLRDSVSAKFAANFTRPVGMSRASWRMYRDFAVRSWRNFWTLSLKNV